MLRLDNAPQAKVHADRVIASLSVCLVSQTERSIVIGSQEHDVTRCIAGLGGHLASIHQAL